ncbi:MAG: MFS transporter [Pedobacter sp.]|nr:MFS transporter [Pedobacter sp.]
MIDSSSKDPIFNLPFALLCLSSLLFSASFNMLIPDLPAYLTKLGGAEYKGLIIALFTLTAGISRPFSGKLTDTIGRVPIMAVGSVVCFLCGFLYPILTSVSGFLFLRLIHGFSTGFKPTATSAYVADIVPKERWGEALGIHGLCFSTGMAIGPAIGSYISGTYSINVLFYSSSLFALMSIIILMNMKETLQNRKKLSFAAFKLSKRDIIDVKVLPAAIVTLLSYVGYGAILTLIPDWGGHLGLVNKGIFFMIFTISSLLIRFVAGKISDKHGRLNVAIAGLVILGVALIAIGYSYSQLGLFIGAVIYGIGTGILSPALNAWTIDLSDPDHRGKAVATMYIFLEAGIGLGALFAGWFYQDVMSMVPPIFYATAAISFTALIYMVYWKNSVAKGIV